jgi:ADP-heptose:LPS heptosyltransferase
MDAPENILLIRLKSIGDVLFTLPAVHVVRENFPSAKITFLTSRENAPLLDGFQEVNDIIAIDRQRLRSGNPLKMTSEFFSLLRRLRTGEFSLVVDFQSYGETAWLARVTGAPRRWGNVYNKWRRWAYTSSVTRDDRLHPVEWNLSLLTQCGLPSGKIRNEYVLSNGMLEEAKRFFAAQNLDTARPTLFIQPFTSSPQKNWPLENFLILAEHWQARGTQIIFGGGPAERVALEPARAAGFPVAAGVPLLVTAGLMKLSTVIVGADTGLLHVAVAMGRRVVMLMGFNTPGSTHPFRHADWTVTPPTGKTVLEIPTAAVIEACDQAFRGLSGAKLFEIGTDTGKDAEIHE